MPALAVTTKDRREGYMERYLVEGPYINLCFATRKQAISFSRVYLKINHKFMLVFPSAAH